MLLFFFFKLSCRHFCLPHRLKAPSVSPKEWLKNHGYGEKKHDTIENFSHSTRCSCLWSLPLSQVCLCVCVCVHAHGRRRVCACVCEESLFVLSSVKARDCRRALPCASHYKKVAAQSKRNKKNTQLCAGNCAVYVLEGEKNENIFDLLRKNTNFF